jgi:hypothetical protein
MSEGDHGIVPTKFAVAVPYTLPNGHPSANIFPGRGWWGVWRGYDVAGVGGGDFALRLILRQRAAPFYRWTRTHTHTQSGFNAEKIEKDNYPESKTVWRLNLKRWVNTAKQSVWLTKSTSNNKRHNLSLKVFHSLHRITLGCKYPN